MKAFEWYKNVAEQGYSDAQNNLAIMYENRLGTVKSYTLAN